MYKKSEDSEKVPKLNTHGEKNDRTYQYPPDGGGNRYPHGGFHPAGLERVHWRSDGADTLHYPQRSQQKYGTRCRYDEARAPVFLSANDSDTTHTDDFASRRS